MLTSTVIFHAGVNCKFMQLMDFQISCGCSTHWLSAIKQGKVFTHWKLKLTHINFAILNSCVIIKHLRFIKNNYFYVVKQKNWKKLYWLLFKEENLYNKMTFVRNNYIPKSVYKQKTIICWKVWKYLCFWQRI